MAEKVVELKIVPSVSVMTVCNTLKKMKELVRPLEESIPIGDDRFGRILHENWMLKKEVSKLISSDQIDSYYKLAIDSGAIGGKLLGAGLGGFLMFFVNAKDKQSVIEAMDGLYCLDIE